MGTHRRERQAGGTPAPPDPQTTDPEAPDPFPPEGDVEVEIAGPWLSLEEIAQAGCVGGMTAPPDPRKIFSPVDPALAAIEAEIAAIGDPYARRDALNDQVHAAAAAARAQYDAAMRTVSEMRAAVREAHAEGDRQAQRLRELTAQRDKARTRTPTTTTTKTTPPRRP